jgi:hypothetical protein
MWPSIAFILAATTILSGIYFWSRYRFQRRWRMIIQGKIKLEKSLTENERNGTLSSDAERLTITSSTGKVLEMPWADVAEVHAFKRDLIVYDLICLLFTGDSKRCIEINEDMAGYRGLLEQLPEHLPGFSEGWHFAVAFPAFATNHQVVWRRSASLKQSTDTIAPPPDTAPRASA